MIYRKIIVVIYGFLFFNDVFAQNSAINKQVVDSNFIKEQYLFKGIADVVRRYHYDPPLFNDSLSKKIFDNYLKKMDPNKCIFLQSDIDSLSRFQYSIDNEMKGEATLSFYKKVQVIYDTRLKEVGDLPFFTNKNWQPLSGNLKLEDGNHLSWSKDTQEKNLRWNKIFSYQYYSKLLDMEKGISNKNERAEKVKTSLQKKYRHFLHNILDSSDPMQSYAQFVNILSSLLDPHTEYQPPVAKAKFDQMMSNAFYGVGVQLKQNDQGEIQLVDLVKGMPASKSGKIKDGDVLIALVEGQNHDWMEIDGLDMTEIASKIRGKEGSVIGMRIKNTNSGEIENVFLTREKINLQQAAVRSTILHTEDGKKVGFLYLPEFYNDYAHIDGAKSADDVASELKLLNSQNIDALIVDLRNNGGGSLSDVVKIAGYFISNGPIVQVRSKDGNVDVLMDEDSDILFKGPMAVLVNGNSASASEIFSAAIQDYHRGLIIGTNTYGKGTVQRPLPLGIVQNGEPEFGAMKLTVQKFYRINGQTTQKIGVTPDIYLPDMYSYLPTKEKDNMSVLAADSVAPARYEKLKDLYSMNGDIYYSWMKKDPSLTKMNDLSIKMSKGFDKYINYDSIKQNQINSKKTLDSYRLLEKMPKDNTPLSSISIGKSVGEKWYKDWESDVYTNRVVNKTVEILLSNK